MSAIESLHGKSCTIDANDEKQQQNNVDRNRSVPNLNAVNVVKVRPDEYDISFLSQPLEERTCSRCTAPIPSNTATFLPVPRMPYACLVEAVDPTSLLSGTRLEVIVYGGLLAAVELGSQYFGA